MFLYIQYNQHHYYKKSKNNNNQVENDTVIMKIKNSEKEELGQKKYQSGYETKKVTLYESLDQRFLYIKYIYIY